jgi:hypothetical protein
MIIAIPLSSVIMGVVIITLSVSSDDGLVADDYYKRGLQINRVLDRDLAAARAGLSAQLRLGDAATRLDLASASPAFPAPAALVLDLSYSTRAGLDRSIELPRLPDGSYSGPALLALAPGRWYVQAAAADWRLTGSLVVPGGRYLEMSASSVDTR